MNENENWIGKKLIDKDNPKMQHTVVGQQNGTLYLDNNGRVDESRVSDNFNVNTGVSDNVDPDSFFNGSYGALIGAIHTPNQAKAVVGVQEQMGTGPVQMMMGDEKALQAYQTGDYAAHQPMQKPKPVPQNMHGLTPEGEVQHFYGESMKDIVDEEEFERVNSQQKVRKQPAKEQSFFDTMKLKKSTPVKIKLVLEEKIPKIEAIRSLNDVFEKSIIEHLAYEITNKFLSDPKILQALVEETLENIVYPSKKKKKPAAKAKGKTAVVKAKPAAKAVAKPATKPVKNSQAKSKTKAVAND